MYLTAITVWQVIICVFLSLIWTSNAKTSTDFKDFSKICLTCFLCFIFYVPSFFQTFLLHFFLFASTAPPLIDGVFVSPLSSSVSCGEHSGWANPSLISVIPVLSGQRPDTWSHSIDLLRIFACCTMHGHLPCSPFPFSFFICLVIASSPGFFSFPFQKTE